MEDLNLFAGQLTWSYEEFWSFKQKAFAWNRASWLFSILCHISGPFTVKRGTSLISNP